MYSEVNSVLNMLGDGYINKLPRSLYNMVVSEKLDTYNPTYEGTIALDMQNIKRESLSMIALFHLNYWCEDENEKNELRQLFKDNEDKYQTELGEKYKTDNLFKELNNSIANTQITENVQMIDYKPQNMFYKILKKLFSFFKK